MSTHVPAGSPQSAKVFISYRREDSAGHAGRLLDRITSYFGDRIEIFMDVDSIAPGEDFIQVIENAVGACEILVAVIGNDWLTITDESGKRRLDNPEDFVRVEIATALKRNVRVIPVLVQGARMPRRDQLPEPLVNLTRRNAIEVSDARWKYDADRLIKTIEEVSSLESAGTANAAQRLASGVGKSRLWSWRVLVPVLGIIFLSIVLWLILPLIRNGSNQVVSNDPSGSNLNSSEMGNNQPNGNTNNSTNANTTPSISPGAGTPGSSTTPITTVPETQGIQVVGVAGRAKGFFTSKGYIVAFVGEGVKVSDELNIVWGSANETAEVVRVNKMTALLKLKNRGLLPQHAPIRLSNSLQKGEAVERFIGPQDRTPGTVLEVDADGIFDLTVLVTTKLSFAGDAGAPVIDSQGRIVAMVFAAGRDQTQSLPIERIKLIFPEAF